MKQIQIKDDFIKLGQLLKLSGLVGSGVEAKMVIAEGLVLVNGNPELQRGKKVFSGDVVTFNEESIQVIR